LVGPGSEIGATQVTAQISKSTLSKKTTKKDHDVGRMFFLCVNDSTIPLIH